MWRSRHNKCAAADGNAEHSSLAGDVSVALLNSTQGRRIFDRRGQPAAHG